MSNSRVNKKLNKHCKEIGTLIYLYCEISKNQDLLETEHSTLKIQ